MPLDFRNAAEGHLDDAEYLLEGTRLANADHLFGVSAECGLKAVMVGLGMRIINNKPEKVFLIHIEKLWSEFITFAHSRDGARYASILSKKTPNPFGDYDINQRYNSRADITLPVVQNHHQAAKTVKEALDAALLDGVVK